MKQKILTVSCALFACLSVALYVGSQPKAISELVLGETSQPITQSDQILDKLPASLDKRLFDSTAQPSQQTQDDLINSPAAGHPAEVVLHQSETASNKVGSLVLQEYRPLLIPDDPGARQWWTTDAGFEAAWDTPRGANSTLLAIIDTGFGLDHEELRDRWHTNDGEAGSAQSESPSRLNCTGRSLAINRNCNLIDDNYDGIIDNETGSDTYENPSRLNCTDLGKPLTRDCNQVDDDSNGLVDDWRGWDFINGDNSVQAGELNPTGTGTHHGTYVTGAAAATGNNGKGIAGADWGTTILPIQALDDDSYGNTLSVANSIRYAAAQGADVISLSLGSDGPDDFVREAVQEAVAAGSVVVASSGNDGCNCMAYPANYPEVIAVGALNQSQQPASFSSWGANLDILAPGVNLTTTDWRAGNQTSAYASGIGGTSLAAPLISGMFTRLLSHQPEATPLQLIAALTENTSRLGLTAAAPRSDTLGFGTLDALKATRRMTIPGSVDMMYGFRPVSGGDKITPEQPAEVAAPLQAYDCRASTTSNFGTTPIFELKKTGSDSVFTASQAEVYRAQERGYSTTLLTRACLTMPHDQTSNLRTVNLFQELRNSNSKLP